MSAEGYPILPEIVAGWVSLGWTKHVAVQSIVGQRLRIGQARGAGSKSKLRAAVIREAQSWGVIRPDAHDFAEFDRRDRTVGCNL